MNELADIEERKMNRKKMKRDCWIRPRMSEDVTVLTNDRSKRRIRQQLIHLEKVTCLLTHQNKNFFFSFLKRHFRETMFQAHLIQVLNFQDNSQSDEHDTS